MLLWASIWRRCQWNLATYFAASDVVLRDTARVSKHAYILRQVCYINRFATNNHEVVVKRNIMANLNGYSNGYNGYLSFTYEFLLLLIRKRLVILLLLFLYMTSFLWVLYVPIVWVMFLENTFRGYYCLQTVFSIGGWGPGPDLRSGRDLGSRKRNWGYFRYEGFQVFFRVVLKNSIDIFSPKLYKQKGIMVTFHQSYEWTLQSPLLGALSISASLDPNQISQNRNYSLWV